MGSGAEGPSIWAKPPVDILRVPLLVPEQCLQTTGKALLGYKQPHTFRDGIDIFNGLLRKMLR